MVKIVIQKRIKDFNKVINVDGDKSLSIRSLLIGSQSYGVSKIKNLPKSEDIFSTIDGLRRLGIKIFFKKQICYLYGNGLNGFNYKKNIVIDAGNSGTFARLLLGLLVKSPYTVKIKGDKSLSRRDFKRIVDPLEKFGAKFISKSKKNLPLKIIGSEYLKPINYFEKKGSAQCKSSVILAALNTPGKTIITAKKSRNHTELFLKNLNFPLKVMNKKKYDKIEIVGENQFKSFNYTIPGDMSSSAFFIVLTLLSKNSKLKIKNVNVNTSRTGFIKIINKMGAKVKFINKRNICGEPVADICVKSQKNLKSINCPIKYNSNAIDEFLIIFLLASKACGVSNFKKLEELNKKESPRLKLASLMLRKIGVKVKSNKDSIKIFGNPRLNINKKIQINRYYKDHRIFMTSVIAALTLGGNWTIHDRKSHMSSFPSFLSILRKIGYRFK
tara:strand:+ start:2932 stop:4257 length:1326 start_codon:yes stop_codon:yes gene_type:complete